MKIYFPGEKVGAFKWFLCEQWPANRRYAKVRGVLSMAGKLWDMTYLVQVGTYLVWRLLRLTRLHHSPGSKT